MATAIIIGIFACIIVKMLVANQHAAREGNSIPCNGGCGKTLFRHETADGVRWTCGDCNRK